MASMAFHLNPLDPVRKYDPTDWVADWLYGWLWQGRLLRRVAPDLDWVGVNYYFRLYVKWDVLPWHLFGHPEMRGTLRSDFDWEIYPEGLYRVLRRVGKLRKPVIVTENGVADASDRLREAFIVEHLRQAHRAIREGLVDLRGYMHWSLMDNFEWAEGYTKRFGLAHVDFESPNKTRTLRPSARAYRRIARANALHVEQSGAGALVAAQ